MFLRFNDLMIDVCGKGFITGSCRNLTYCSYMNEHMIVRGRTTNVVTEQEVCINTTFYLY